MKNPRKSKRGKPRLEPTGVPAIDGLADTKPITINDYIRAVSSYVTGSDKLASGPKKSAQIRLSNALGRAFETDFKAAVPKVKELRVGETRVSGALRTVDADVSETHPLDGLRLAVELKPINLAVGRAIWNRFGDLRTFAVNLHLKFPFCVVGGVLVIPLYERTKQKQKAISATVVASKPDDSWRATGHLIERAIERLVRAGGRKTEGEAPHLLEGISVVVYDPFAAEIDMELPETGSGLRWDEFIAGLASAYDGRFEK